MTIIGEEMIERVACAIYESQFGDEWVGGGGVEAAMFRQCAEAAIDAMGSPEAVTEMREALEPFASIEIAADRVRNGLLFVPYLSVADLEAAQAALLKVTR